MAESFEEVMNRYLAESAQLRSDSDRLRRGGDYTRSQLARGQPVSRLATQMATPQQQLDSLIKTYQDLQQAYLRSQSVGEKQRIQNDLKYLADKIQQASPDREIGGYPQSRDGIKRQLGAPALDQFVSSGPYRGGENSEVIQLKEDDEFVPKENIKSAEDIKDEAGFTGEMVPDDLGFPENEVSPSAQEDDASSVSPLEGSIRAEGGRTLGVSDTDLSQLPAGALQALGGAENFQTAMALAKAFQPEDKPIDPALLAFQFFTNMAAQASKPGATALGAAGEAARVPVDYLMKDIQSKKDREAELKKTALTLALGMKPSAKDYLTLFNEEGESRIVNINQPEFAEAREAGFISTTKPAAKSLSTKFYQANAPITINDVTYEEGDVIPLTDAEVASLKDRRGISEYKAPSDRAPATLEDAFGDIRYAEGPNKGELVFPITRGELTATEETSQAGQESGQLNRLTKAQSSFAAQMRDDIRSDLTTFDQVSYHWASIRDYFNNPGAISDYGLAVAFAKLIDPNSVAREGEVRAVQGVGAMSQKVKQQIINALNGQGAMPPRVRAEIYNAGLRAYNSRLQKVLPKLQGYKASADAQGVDFGHVYFGGMPDYVSETKLVNPEEYSMEVFELNDDEIPNLSVEQIGEILKDQDKVGRLTVEQIKKLREKLKKLEANNNG